MSQALMIIISIIMKHTLYCTQRGREGGTEEEREKGRASERERFIAAVKSFSKHSRQKHFRSCNILEALTV